MLIPISTQGELEVKDLKVKNMNFKELKLKEANVEEFIRKNIGKLFDETLLIVGQQVHNRLHGISDLTALNKDGNLVLVEIKRDKEDEQQRKEAFEFQAIRYAASCATIKTPEELADKIFVKYIEKHKNKFELSHLTPRETAFRKINKFLEDNNAFKTFNVKQRIILIASSFNEQISSAAAWLISNGVDISCYSITPIHIENINHNFLQFEKILPTTQLEDFYIDIPDAKSNLVKNSAKSVIMRNNLPRMDKLFEWGLIKPGDNLIIKNYDNSNAKAINEKIVEYEGKELSYNQWGILVTGWSSINIYDWTIPISENNNSRKTLHELRSSKLEE